MSEKAAPAVDLSGVKPSTPPAARPRPPATPSYIFNPLNFVVISGLFYLVFQSLDYEPIVQHIYRQGRSLLGLPPDASAEDGGSRLYAVCTQGGNYIYTSEEGGEFQCILVNDGLIVGMGYQSELETIAATITSRALKESRADKEMGLQVYHVPEGGIVTPGFTDAHAHTLQYGHAQQLNLLGCRSIDEVIQRLEKYVDENQDSIKSGAWVEGQGWDQTLWEGADFPTAADFERSPKLKDLPIALSRIDIHAEWISQPILSLLPALPETVEGGKIIRFSNGSATGVFLDDAMNLIDLVRPQWTETQMEGFLKRTVNDAVKVGVTGIHDAYGLPEHIEFYQRMAEQGKLPIRFYIMRKCPDKDKYCGDVLPMIDNAGDGKLNVKSVKLFADGALGSWGAALLEPYSDKPDESGIMRTPEEAWMPLIDDFVRNGWQTNAHCIGDRANRVVLDAMEAAIIKYGPADRRLRIEHSQIMTEDDLARAVRLGVIASYQPTHATSDMWYAKDRLGEERLKGAYAWQTYIQLGGRIALGSDFPVESIDPLKGFFAAISRTNEKGESPHGPDGWYPEQKLTRKQALQGFTIDAAYASFQENTTGSFRAGKKFDAVIWDRNIMQINPPTAVLEAKVLATIVDGKVVYGSVKL